MISPYVRRLRLAGELRSLRTEYGLTHDALAARTGLSRAAISRLENGHVVDQADIFQILDALDIDGHRWTELVTIARGAGERGWWESNKDMGARQALCADLEAGATTIHEFQMSFLPGLLQTPDFARARVEAEGLGEFDGRVADRAVEARNGRQRMLRRPGGPSYGVIVDELAIRRRAASSEIVKAQLYHIAARVNGDPSTTVRVLPVDAMIEGFNLPRSAFSIYSYPDPDDPTVVAVDTITDDLILTEDNDVKRYQELYQQLREASLPETDGLRFLIDVAGAAPPPGQPGRPPGRGIRP